MKLLFTFLVLISFNNSYAQDENKNIEYFNRMTYPECRSIPFIWEDGSHKISFPSGNDELTNYFLKNISEKRLLFYTGKLGIQILLNTDGKPCCRSVYLINGDLFLEDFKLFKFDSIVNSMPDWIIKKPADPALKKNNYCVMLDLEFFGDGNIRVSYNPFKRRRFIN